MDFFFMPSIINICVAVIKEYNCEKSWIYFRKGAGLSFLLRYVVVLTEGAIRHKRITKVCYKSYALVPKWSEGYLYTILIPRGIVLTPSLSLFGYNNNRKSIRRGV